MRRALAAVAWDVFFAWEDLAFDFEAEDLVPGFVAVVDDFFPDFDEDAFLLEDVVDFREEACASSEDDDAARPRIEPSKTKT